jgi:hypothetical protein
MSKHIPRKARWTRLNDKEHRSAFGAVRYRAGAWEGTVVYELRHADGQADAVPVWRPQETFAGRFKRPRNAMIGVEDKAREVLRRHGENVRIAFEDRTPARARDLP